MPCEVLILAQNLGGTGKRKGDIFLAKDQPAIWGTGEGLPNFIRVTVTDATADEVLPQNERYWLRKIDWTIDQHNVPQDRYTITAFATNNSVSGLGNLTRDVVETWLLNWNISVLSASANAVQVRFTIFEAATSQRFWKYPVNGIVWNEISYDQGTGTHRIEADYSALTWATPLGIENKARRRSTIISHDETNRIITVDILRTFVLQELKREVADQCEDVIEKWQYHISEADVDTVVGLGGTVNRTKAQWDAAVLDKKLE